MKTARAITVGVALLIGPYATQAAQRPQVMWETNAHPLDVAMSIGFSRDGRLIGFGTQGYTFDVWDFTNRTLIRTFGPDATDGDKGTCLAFSPDGTQIAGGG